MKKVLILLLHRTPDGESVKDGGPALAREVINAFKRKGCQVDSISGNTMNASKQHSDVASPFLQRMEKARDFAKEITQEMFAAYDMVVFFHPSTVMGFEAEQLPLGKMVLFPTLLGEEYKYFMEVPDEYLAIEKKILNYGYMIQCPSHTQANMLIEKYNVSKKSIFIQPRGFSPTLFPTRERSLRKDISVSKPLRLLSANAVRPQKGYITLIELVQFCNEKNFPILVVVYGDTVQSTNKSYLAYAKEFIATIEKNNLGQYFEFHPAINQELLSIEMEKADRAIIPSLYESFGKSALESSASGLPTIVFDDVAAYKEFLDTICAIFVPRTKEGFYEKMSEIISDPQRYHQLSISGIENGKKYPSQRIYDELISKIESTIHDQ